MPSDTRCPTCDGTGNARCSACPRFPDAACCYPEPTCPPCPDCNGSGRHDTSPADPPRDEVMAALERMTRLESILRSDNIGPLHFEDNRWAYADYLATVCTTLRTFIERSQS